MGTLVGDTNALHSKRLELLRQNVVNISITLQLFLGTHCAPIWSRLYLIPQQMWAWDFYWFFFYEANLSLIPNHPPTHILRHIKGKWQSKTNRRLFIVLDPDVLIRRVTLILIEGDDVGGGGIVALSHQVIPCSRSLVMMMVMVMVNILAREGLSLILLSLSAPNDCFSGALDVQSPALGQQTDRCSYTVMMITILSQCLTGPHQLSPLFPLSLLLFRGLQSSNGVSVISASFLSA